MAQFYRQRWRVGFQRLAAHLYQIRAYLRINAVIAFLLRCQIRKSLESARDRVTFLLISLSKGFQKIKELIGAASSGNC